jgi:hypothetical protein
MERDHLEKLGLDGKIILNLVLKKSFGRAWMMLVRLRIW